MAKIAWRNRTTTASLKARFNVKLAVAGSRSRPLPNWLLTKVDEITDLVMLDQTFPGGRPTASGKHIQWDVLFIRVKPIGRSRPANISKSSVQ